MSVQISGSIAFDTIMVFEGRFKDHILPEQTHMLNVAFLAPQMRQEYGGCAANIAYTLRGLGQECGLLGAIGKDGGEYLERLTALNIDTSRVLLAQDCYCAQAFITTDLDDNQITAFHPGAMNRAGEIGLDGATATLGIVSPNGREAMIRHASEFAANGVPFVFDPGQAMPIFDAKDLSNFVSQATWVAVNDYEGHMLAEKLGVDMKTLARELKGGLVVTRGAEGVEITDRNGTVHIQGLDVSALLGAAPTDPTGCGDAFRGGLLFGLARGASLLDSARLGNLMGAIKVTHRGGQNHVVRPTEVARHLQTLYPDTADRLRSHLQL
ncbi:MAG: carbohydrate kinase family protein [Burkholderiaceae bacterium]|nr:carbohydrate kinase family protein [Burkholderiaceae bacterium]